MKSLRVNKHLMESYKDIIITIIIRGKMQVCREWSMWVSCADEWIIHAYKTSSLLRTIEESAE